MCLWLIKKHLRIHTLHTSIACAHYLPTLYNIGGLRNIWWYIFQILLVFHKNLVYLVKFLVFFHLQQKHLLTFSHFTIMIVQRLDAYTFKKHHYVDFWWILPQYLNLESESMLFEFTFSMLSVDLKNIPCVAIIHETIYNFMRWQFSTQCEFPMSLSCEMWNRSVTF